LPGNESKAKEENEEEMGKLREEDEDGQEEGENKKEEEEEGQQKNALDLTIERAGRGGGQRKQSMMEAAEEEEEKQPSRQCVGLLKIKEPANTIFGGTQSPLIGANFPQSASSIEQLLLGPMAGRSALYSASAFLSMLQQRGAAAAATMASAGAHGNTQMVGTPKWIDWLHYLLFVPFIADPKFAVAFGCASSPSFCPKNCPRNSLESSSIGT
jgi:hypothetical protein